MRDRKYYPKIVSDKTVLCNSRKIDVPENWEFLKNNLKTEISEEKKYIQSAMGSTVDHFLNTMIFI